MAKVDNAPIEIAGVFVNPGERRRLEIPVARLPTGTWLSLPIMVVNGAHPGPTAWLSAAVHGDEVNGVEIIGVGCHASQGLRKGVVINIEGTVTSVKKAV